MDEKKGDKAYKKAKEEITISIFNWSKDYASAASTFDEAFKHYKTCGAHQKALKTLQELIVCNQKLTDPWAMAKNYEAMIDLYLEHIPVETITKCFIQYRMAESLDNGLKMITKVTKHLQKSDKNKEAMQLLQDSYQIALEDDKSFKKKELFGKIIQNFIENEFYEQAIKMYYEEIKRRNGEGCEQEALIIIILEIIIGDMKRAEQQMFQLGNIVPTWLTSDDCECADNLIKFYKSGQSQKFKKETTKAAVTTLFPIVIIRKVRAVIVPSAEKFNKATDNEKEQMIEKMLF